MTIAVEAEALLAALLAPITASWCRSALSEDVGATHRWFRRLFRPKSFSGAPRRDDRPPPSHGGAMDASRLQYRPVLILSAYLMIRLKASQDVVLYA